MFFKGPFGGAYLRREICVSKLIGLAYSSKEIYRFSLFDFVLEGTFQVQAPGGGGGEGAYNWRGDLSEGVLRYKFGGLINGGAYFRNFTVIISRED